MIVCKVGYAMRHCAFPTRFEFRMGQFRDADHREDALHSIQPSVFINISNFPNIELMSSFFTMKALISPLGCKCSQNSPNFIWTTKNILT